jgi:hypothetical protein
MGVPVKKNGDGDDDDDDISDDGHIHEHEREIPPMPDTPLVGVDNKKRKR